MRTAMLVASITVVLSIAATASTSWINAPAGIAAAQIPEPAALALFGATLMLIARRIRNL